MAFSFEIAAIETLTARVVLRDGGTDYRADFDSFIGRDGLAQFLRAAFDVVDDRLWGAVCHWAGDEDDGWFVAVRPGTARCEVAVFRQDREDWPPALPPASAVFRARIDRELDLARSAVAAYRSALERYGAERYADLWQHPFPQSDLDALTDWIRRREAWDELFALQDAVWQQVRMLRTRDPEAIAAALGRSPARVAAVLRHLDPGRQYTTWLELELRYVDPDWL